MYKIRIAYAYGTDGLHPERVVHDPANDLWVHSAKLAIALNEAGSLTFETDVTHPHAAWIRNNVMKFGWLVHVEDDGDVIWTGRISSVSTNRVTGNISVECEGLLATLNDGVVEPYNFSGAPEDLLEALLVDAGNSYGYEVGTVTVTDPNGYIVRSNEDYVSAWDEVKDKTFGSSLGGYMFAHWDGEARKVVVDWLEDPGESGVQVIEYAENLLDLQDEEDGTDLCTGIMPYGAVVDESSAPPTYVTLKELSDQTVDGVDIIGNLGWAVLHSLYETKGFLIQPVHFPNCTTVNGLKASAVKYVKANLEMQRTYRVKAIDRRFLDPEEERLVVGNSYTIEAPDASVTLTLIKASLDLLHPESDDYEFGKPDRGSISSSSGGGGGGGSGFVGYLYHNAEEYEQFDGEYYEKTHVTGLLSDEMPDGWATEPYSWVVITNEYHQRAWAPLLHLYWGPHDGQTTSGNPIPSSSARIVANDVRINGRDSADMWAGGDTLHMPRFSLIRGSSDYTGARATLYNADLVIKDGTGNDKKCGIVFEDPNGDMYYALRQGDSDLVIGYDNRSASYHHHAGRTFISSGYNSSTSRGYTSAYVMVPNDTNTGGTYYSIFHTGYLDLSKATAGPVPSAYLPTASSSVKGAVKVDGSTITIDSNGVISSHGGGSGTVTGVKGNAESAFRTGNVNLTPANIGAAASSHSHSASDITSGTLNIARIPTGTTSTTVALGDHTHEYADITDAPEVGNTTVFYGTCTTAAATQEKAVTCSAFTASDLAAGTVIFVRMQYAQDASVTSESPITLNVNGTGAVAIKYESINNAALHEWRAGEMICMVHDGTYWIIVDDSRATTSYYGVVKLSDSATTSVSSLALTPAGLSNLVQGMIEPYDRYSTLVTYEVGDRVRKDYQAWECTTAVTTPMTWDESYWTPLPPIQEQIDNFDVTAMTTQEVYDAVDAGWV